MRHEPSLSMALIDSIDRSALGNQACACVSLFLHLACIVPDHLQWHFIPPNFHTPPSSCTPPTPPSHPSQCVSMSPASYTPPACIVPGQLLGILALLALNRNEHPIHTRDYVCSQCLVRKQYRFLGKR